MDRPTVTLAEHKGFGKIYQCECGSIHVQAGPVSITFSTAGYMQFVEMVHTSAANFETVRSELDAL
jgi:hypothetical protein